GYSYDLNSYLISATQPGSRFPASEGSFTNETFQYDEIGNRTSDQTGAYLFDTTRQTITEGPKYRYYHDNEGNMIGRVDKVTGEFTKFGYSTENQLVAVKTYPDELATVATKEAYYYYDALGRRMKKQVVDHQHPSDAL